jgi:hypothetical protein
MKRVNGAFGVCVDGMCDGCVLGLCVCELVCMYMWCVWVERE